MIDATASGGTLRVEATPKAYTSVPPVVSPSSALSSTETQSNVDGSGTRFAKWSSGAGGINPSHEGRSSDALSLRLGREGSVIMDWAQANPWAATAVRLVAELAGEVLPSNVRVDPQLLQRYLDADTVLLGRYYRHEGASLEELRDRYVPGAVLLQGQLGIGRHLEENVHAVIDQAEHILLREQGLLERWSFSYRELLYILSKSDLIARSEVIAEDGTRAPLERWAGERGLLDTVTPIQRDPTIPK